MGRLQFMVDRALIVRQVEGQTYGAKFKADDVEIGDWIPCRLRVPDGDVEFDKARYGVDPDFILHLNPYDLTGVRIKLRPFDVLRVYQRINDYWVEYDAPFVIVGAIQPRRRRTRLVSYTVPVKRGTPPER